MLLDEDTVNRELLYLLMAPPGFIVLDLKWSSQRDDCIDVVQIRVESRIFIIHLASMRMSCGGPEDMPAVLRELLTHSSIMKFGVDIHGAFTITRGFHSELKDGRLAIAVRLFLSHGLNLPRCADIGHLAFIVDKLSWPLSVSFNTRLREPRYWFKAPSYKIGDTRALERLTFAYTNLVLSKKRRTANWNEKLTIDMIFCKCATPLTIE